VPANAVAKLCDPRGPKISADRFSTTLAVAPNLLVTRNQTTEPGFRDNRQQKETKEAGRSEAKSRSR
jgi:hypothetical protein